MSLTWAVQNALVAKAKEYFQDDPHVSAVISAVVVSAVGYASLYSVALLKSTVNTVKRKIYPKPLKTTTEQRIFVSCYADEQVSGNNSVLGTRRNELFIAMEWFITKFCKECSNVTAFVSHYHATDRVRLVPSVNVRHSFEWKGLNLNFCMLDRAVPGESTKREVGIEIKGEVGPQQLQDFSVQCWEEYFAHVNKRVWSQRLWTCCGKDWIPQYTHNSKLWKNVVLPHDVKSAFMTDLSNFMASESWYSDVGASWTRGYLLYGEAGCGKTSLIKAMSNSYQMDIYCCNLKQISDDGMLNALFRDIPKRSVVVMEDIDAMGTCVHARGEKDDSDDKEESKTRGVTLSGLLNVIDGLVNAHGRLLVMTTNHKDKLDPALIRPGRVDMQIHLKYCTTQQVLELFFIICGHKLSNIRVPDYVLSPADVSSILMTYRNDCEEAVRQVENLACERKRQRRRGK